MSEQPAIEWQFECPPDVQAEREIILVAMGRAMDEGTLEAIKGSWDAGLGGKAPG